MSVSIGIKKSITLNLKSEEGKKIFLELVKQADVVVENFRPGVMERLGLGYETLREVNERIVYGCISGFGSDGLYCDRPAYDVIAQAMGGIMSLTGEEGGEPLRVGTSIADVTAGMNLTVGILAALHARSWSGKGQKVEVSLTDSIIALSPSENNRYFITGKAVPRIGNRNIGNCPYGAFQAKDGYYILACGKDALFARFCTKVLKRPELAVDERYRIMAARGEHQEEIKSFIEEWSKDLTVAEAVETLLKESIPAAPILGIEEIAHDEHFVVNRNMFPKMEQPGIGEFTVTNIPIKLEGTKTEIRMPAPFLGQHNEEIYNKYLNYNADDIDALRNKGVL